MFLLFSRRIQPCFRKKVKFNFDGEDYIKNISIDAKNQTETFHIPKMNSSNAGEVDVIYDFKSKVRVRLLTNLFRTVSLVNLIPYFFFLIEYLLKRLSLQIKYFLIAPSAPPCNEVTPVI